MSKDGKNFEKRAIMDWLNRGNVCCPLTRQPLKPSLLVPNVNLRLKINRWRKDNVVEGSDDDGDDTSTSSDDSDVGFVGLVQVDEDRGDANNCYRSSAIRTNHNHNIVNDHRGAAGNDDLADLLELYNEVLELTSTPFDSMTPPAPRRASQGREPIVPNHHHHVPVPSRNDLKATADAALGALVARHAARRSWRPKLFPNKRTTSSKHNEATAAESSS